jgi:serine/threonine-protein kinase
MSVVYRAVDQRLDRAVALKVLRWDRGLGDADALLRKEARALARVSSPFVVEVYDVGEHLGAVYVVMELVVGATLRQYATRAPSAVGKKVPPERLIDAIVQAGRGLADAHEAGVIHGDVKPENILISQRKDLRRDTEVRAKISDFGLALVPRARTSSEFSEEFRSQEGSSYPPRNVSSSEQLRGAPASASSLVGTPAYMAPELFWGTSPNAGSDQYAFCVTAYEALVRERPFANLGAEDLRALNDVALFARAARVPLPAAAARALVRGLHPDPTKRHPNVRTLVEALRPRRWGTGALAAAAAVLAAVVGISVWSVATRPVPDRCLEVATVAEGLTNAQTRSDFQKAFLATHAADAAESAHLVDAEWTRFFDEWTTERIAACRRAAPEARSAVRHVPSPAEKSASTAASPMPVPFATSFSG